MKPVYLRRNNLFLCHRVNELFNKPGIREEASNGDTGPEFLFAQLKPEGANWKCGNMDLFFKKNIWITLEDDK